MNRSFVSSIILHSILLGFIAYVPNQDNPPIEITIKTSKSKQVPKKKEKYNKDLSGSILPKGLGGKNSKDSQFYYGIGVYMSFNKETLITTDNKTVEGCRIVGTSEGYPADLSGLLPGDYIVLYNDEQYDFINSPIKVDVDDGKQFSIVVYRDGKLLKFYMKRAKIYIKY